MKMIPNGVIRIKQQRKQSWSQRTPHSLGSFSPYFISVIKYGTFAVLELGRGHIE